MTYQNLIKTSSVTQKEKTSKVMESFENDLEDRCVDFFVRDDGTFGFEEYRRDHEEGGRWSKVGQFSGTRFSSLEVAKASAKYLVPWLPSSSW